MDTVTVMLSVEGDEDAMEFVQEWASQYARDIRKGLAALEYDATVLLTTSDGVCEYH